MNLYAAAGTTVVSSSLRNGTAENASSLSMAPGDGMDNQQMEHNPYAVALALVPLLTIFGNALVILAVCREKSLRTVTNLLIMSLAISDLLVALCVMFFAVYFEWNSFVWDLGPTLCNLYIGADVACSTASILNLLAISIDRYIAISHPLAYCQIGTNSRAYVSIALVWGVSISVAIPLAFGANRIESEHECAFTNPVFMISSSVLSFFLPCLAMIALYAIVFMRLRQRESARTARKRHAALNGTETALIANALIGGARMARHIARSHLKDQLLLELSIQTSSYPTASDEDEDDDCDDDDDEVDTCDGSSERRDMARRVLRHKSIAAHLHAQPGDQRVDEDDQQRRPTLSLMMNGGKPFPMAPMNPLQLPSTALTLAERRVKGWRRKRTLRLMRRCNTLPSTVMHRQKLQPVVVARGGDTVAADEETVASAARCQQSCPTVPPRELLRHAVANAVVRDATADEHALVEEEDTNSCHADHDDDDDDDQCPKALQSDQPNYATDQRQLAANCADQSSREQQKLLAEQRRRANTGSSNGTICGDNNQIGDDQQQQLHRCSRRPPAEAADAVHLCSNSFGDKLAERFPFIDQQQNEQQQQQHEEEQRQSAALSVGHCSPRLMPESPSAACQLNGTRCSVRGSNPLQLTDPSLFWHIDCTLRRLRHNSYCGDFASTTNACRRHANANCDMRRTHSDTQRRLNQLPNFAFQTRHQNGHLPITVAHSAAAEAASRCTACAGCVAVSGTSGACSGHKDANNNNNNIINNANASSNNIYSNNANDNTNTLMDVQLKGKCQMNEAAQSDAYCVGTKSAMLAMRSNGDVPIFQQQKQQQEHKRRKQYGGGMLALARFVHWTRGQRRTTAGIGNPPADGLRLIRVIESATSVGAATDQHKTPSAIANKSGVGGGTRRSVRIRSRSPPERCRSNKNNGGTIYFNNGIAMDDGTMMPTAMAIKADTTNNANNDPNANYDDNDQSPEWNGAESSAAALSSYRLLLEGDSFMEDASPTDRPRNSCAMEQSTRRDDSSPLANGILPLARGCRRACTVSGVPKKKSSCASTAFTSSPLRHIRQAFRRSLVPIIEEGRKPSRALLKRANRHMRREQKATVTLAVVLAVFLCCWVPFFALHLSNAICLLSGGVQCVHLLAMFLSTWLGYLNSSLNPLIYTVFDKRFRKAFRNLLGCAGSATANAIGRREASMPRG